MIWRNLVTVTTEDHIDDYIYVLQCVDFLDFIYNLFIFEGKLPNCCETE